MEKNDTYYSILTHLNEKIYGTTIYIGQTEVTTIYGKFTCFTFQDLIHKGYIIALCHGDLSAETLYTRMHSSCVTSETLRSLDCDCVSQLYGALKKIAENNGILFYLIQEGRGCGYVGKSRACMNVQYHENTEDEINTFQAYESLGMVHDYRQYNNVKEIMHLMDLDPEFILLTNNPDKIEKFKSLKIRLNRVETIEIRPNPFNQQYLHSKEEYGHILYQTKTKVSKYDIPHEKVKPFSPYPLAHAKRFIHVSSYYLPIKPTWGKVVLTTQEFALLKSKYPDHVFPYQTLDADSYYVKVDEKVLSENSDLLCKPYWFKVNVFYDIVTHNDYLILEYGMDEDNSRTPIVRIHSESIFNRFPLEDRLYKYRYKRSLEYIVRNGKGVILILYHDGRGSGLGYYVLNSHRDEKSKLTVSQEFIDTLGVEEDRRDYYGALTLLKTFSLSKSRTHAIDVIHGETSYDTLKQKMDAHRIKVRHWIDVNHQTDLFGYESIYSRICQTPGILRRLRPTLDRVRSVFSDSPDHKYIVTGIGSSESHAKYLVNALHGIDVDIRYVSVLNLNQKALRSNKTRLIVFSQGMSYNSIPIMNKFKYHNIILITTYNGGDPKKDDHYSQLIQSDSSDIINYPPEVPDDTLIRVTGPYCGYVIADAISRALGRRGDFDLENTIRVIENMRIDQSLGHDFISSFGRSTDLTLILPDDMYEFHKDISNRFIEGTFTNTTICSTFEFVHGFYQKMLNDGGMALIVKTENSTFQNRLDLLLQNEKRFTIDLSSIDNDLTRVLVLLSILNDAVYQLMQRLNVNQKNWPGKESQHIMYDLTTGEESDTVLVELDRIKRRYE
jgi:3,4-dihydroxy 2-butanone 4-phosphate synthase / GTP cyclohydrolase II